MQITEFSNQLLTALGDDRAFMSVYAQVKSLDRATVTAIANTFNGPVAPSASRTKALGNILSRHRKLVEFCA